MSRPGRTRMGRRWEAYSQTPFALLVSLFMKRIFYGNSANEDELNFSMGTVLMLLTIPGGFISLFLFDKYASLLHWLRREMNFDALSAAMPDEYFFIVLSMAVTGGVALWWWDSIFPDRRDFANLVHLPIATSRIFVANAVAIVALALLFAVDVNGASFILFPAVVGAAQPKFGFVVKFGLVHAVVVVLASIFSFFAVFAAVGLLMLVLPYGLFRKISLYIRGLLMVSLLAALSTSFAVPHLVANLPRSPHSAIRFLPSVWFLGFCQVLRGRADPALAQLGHVGMLAVPAVCVLALIAYALSYRRCFIRLPEIADAPPGNLGARTSWIFRALDFGILRTPFQRAGYRFVLKTLLRNDAHALTLGGFAGLGIVLASRALFSAFNGKGLGALPSAELLSVPLILTYCLLFGVRFAFDVPAALPANWTFRLLLDRDKHQSAALARRVMLSFVFPWLFLVALPVYAYFWGWTIALIHTGLVAVWSVLFTEILLVRFRKLPFTCTYPPFQHSAVVSVIICVLGFMVFSEMTAQLESEAFASPGNGIILLIVCLAVWAGIRRVRQGVVGVDRELVFEDVASSGFEFLHLSDGM